MGGITSIYNNGSGAIGTGYMRYTSAPSQVSTSSDYTVPAMSVGECKLVNVRNTHINARELYAPSSGGYLVNFTSANTLSTQLSNVNYLMLPSGLVWGTVNAGEYTLSTTLQFFSGGASIGTLQHTRVSAASLIRIF